MNVICQKKISKLNFNYDILIINFFFKYRNQYYPERRGHGRDYPSIKKPYSHSSSSEPKPKNQDIEKKGDQSSKITSAPKNNKTEPVKDQNEKDLEAPKPEEETKPVNGSI